MACIFEIKPSKMSYLVLIDVAFFHQQLMPLRLISKTSPDLPRQHHHEFWLGVHHEHAHAGHHGGAVCEESLGCAHGESV
jgi:hypothetical protein